MTTEIKQFCTFRVGDLYLGADVQEVQEVIRYLPMTGVPLAPAEIGGLINLRGQIVTAIELRQRFELPARSAETPPMNVILRTADGAVSLLVDEIGDVLVPDPQTLDRVPDTLQGAAQTLVTGVYKLSDKLLLVLNIDNAINPAC